jgi:hypothetical protein
MTDVAFDRQTTLAKGFPTSFLIKGAIWRGIASSNLRDEEGDVITADQLDVSYLNSRKGFFNWEHGRDVEDILGHINNAIVIKTPADRMRLAHVTGMTIPESATLYLEGEFGETPKAKAAIELLKAGNQSLGLSVDGSLLRDKETGKPVRAFVRGVALTAAPTNTATYVELKKSFKRLNPDRGAEGRKRRILRGLDRLTKSAARAKDHQLVAQLTKACISFETNGYIDPAVERFAFERGDPFTN